MHGVIRLRSRRRADLSTWPRTLPEPPEELWACLKAVTTEAEREGAITPEGCVAAITLAYLAMARAIRRVRR